MALETWYMIREHEFGDDDGALYGKYETQEVAEEVACQIVRGHDVLSVDIIKCVHVTTAIRSTVPKVVGSEYRLNAARWSTIEDRLE